MTVRWRTGENVNIGASITPGGSGGEESATSIHHQLQYIIPRVACQGKRDKETRGQGEERDVSSLEHGVVIAVFLLINVFVMY